MSTSTDQLVEEIAKGDKDAAAFLVGWHRLCHLIDDVVDGDASPRATTQVARWANELYSSPFYVQHFDTLGPLVQLITCTFEDSVEMSQGLAWEAREADVIRHCGADMVRMVAFIVGGYQHMRKFSRQLREICYREHHDELGNPK